MWTRMLRLSVSLIASAVLLLGLQAATPAPACAQPACADCLDSGNDYCGCYNWKWITEPEG